MRRVVENSFLFFSKPRYIYIYVSTYDLHASSKIRWYYTGMTEFHIFSLHNRNASLPPLPRYRHQLHRAAILIIHLHLNHFPLIVGTSENTAGGRIILCYILLPRVHYHLSLVRQRSKAWSDAAGTHVHITYTYKYFHATIFLQ